MKVSLIDYTGAGHENYNDGMYAADLLIFTKNTRLQMSPGLLTEIRLWPIEKKMEELRYMANTIPSSWEFIHYTFMIEDVTRAFTHQFVRSRNCSFAQQTMRVLNVEGWKYSTGPSINGIVYKDGFSTKRTYDDAMKMIDETYRELIKRGTKIEDARGILPTNILTNIVMSCNMRTFVEMVQKRSSSRTQGEYRDVLRDMKLQVISVHPWMIVFIERDFDKAISDLEEKFNNPTICHPEKKNDLIKLLDQLRAKQ